MVAVKDEKHTYTTSLILPSKSIRMIVQYDIIGAQHPKLRFDWGNSILISYPHRPGKFEASPM